MIVALGWGKQWGGGEVGEGGGGRRRGKEEGEGGRERGRGGGGEGRVREEDFPNEKTTSIHTFCCACRSENVMSSPKLRFCSFDASSASIQTETVILQSHTNTITVWREYYCTVSSPLAVEVLTMDEHDIQCFTYLFANI